MCQLKTVYALQMEISKADLGYPSTKAMVGLAADGRLELSQAARVSSGDTVLHAGRSTLRPTDAGLKPRAKRASAGLLVP